MQLQQPASPRYVAKQLLAIFLRTIGPLCHSLFSTDRGSHYYGRV